MRALFRTISFVHVLLGLLFTIGLIDSIQTAIEFPHVIWGLKVFFYLSSIIPACLFILFQFFVIGTDARKILMRRSLLGAHFPLSPYIFFYFILPILACSLPKPLALTVLAFVILVQLLDRNLASVFGRIIAMLLGILTSYIILM